RDPLVTGVQTCALPILQFGPAAQLALLVSGPMIDLKLGALYAGTFRRGFLPMLVAAVFATTLVGAMWVLVVAGGRTPSQYGGRLTRARTAPRHPERGAPAGPPAG